MKLKRKYTRQTPLTIRMIRKLWASGKWTQCQIANLTDSSQSNISYIVNRITHG